MAVNCFVIKVHALERKDFLGGVKSISGKSSSSAGIVVDVDLAVVASTDTMSWDLMAASSS